MNPLQLRRLGFGAATAIGIALAACGSNSQSPPSSSTSSSGGSGATVSGSAGSSGMTSSACLGNGELCHSVAACCASQQSTGTCFDAHCEPYCTSDADCAGGCCMPSSGGRSVCAPAANCVSPSTGGSGGAGGSSGCVAPSVSCPALGSVPAACWASGTVCTSVTECSGVLHACTSAGQKFDCVTSTCVASSGTGGSGAGGASSGGSGGSAAGGAATHVVACGTGNPSATGNPSCSCSAETGSGSAVYQGTCGPGAGLETNQTCCVANGYPKAGGSCACYHLVTSPQWACLQAPGYCSCGYAVQGGATASLCNNVPDPNGTRWRCCAEPSDDQCSCFAAASTTAAPEACAAGEIEVSACTNAIPQIQRPISSCADVGATGIGTCTPDGNACKTASDCGDCVGTDPMCCPTCTSGACGLFCCGTSGCTSL